MTSSSEKDLSNALAILNQIMPDLSIKKICELSDEQKEEYGRLLSEFKETHKSSNKQKNTKEKGKALENLVSYLLKISGNLLYVAENLRTSTNEIDQLVQLNTTGALLVKNGLLNPKFETMICECKNYNKSVGVTYVGKFCSLLLCHDIKIGILFSYHGITGSGWSDGAGLIRKFYLHKEKHSERYCIINFSIREFESILEGKNLFEIIDEQINSLRFDTDYGRYLSSHPAQKQVI